MEDWWFDRNKTAFIALAEIYTSWNMKSQFCGVYFLCSALWFIENNIYQIVTIWLSLHVLEGNTGKRPDRGKKSRITHCRTADWTGFISSHPSTVSCCLVPFRITAAFLLHMPRFNKGLVMTKAPSLASPVKRVTPFSPQVCDRCVSFDWAY